MTHPNFPAKLAGKDPATWDDADCAAADIASLLDEIQGLSTSLRRAIQALEGENEGLKQENLRLKEENLRLRMEQID